jgi:alpha-amylase
MRNYRLSDDVSFRFSTQGWPEYPLTADKYARWLAGNEGQVINLFMDYETFGEHQWHETGIFQFLEHLPGEVFKHPHLDFVTTKEAVERYEPVGTIDVPYVSSWADVDRDLTAWLGNEMQRNAFESVKRLEGEVKALSDDLFLDMWRKLQTSDHFYYMCTKWFADGDIHKYFNDYVTPYDAYMNYMNILSDFKRRHTEAKTGKTKSAEEKPENGKPKRRRMRIVKKGNGHKA